MNHKIKFRKLNITSSHRKAMLANMAVSLIMHEQIKTTLPKAKELRPYIEKIVTLSRNNTLATRRKLISIIKDEIAVRKLIDNIGLRFSSRNGGYTRIIKAGYRYGDMAPMAFIEFVEKQERDQA